MITKEELKHFFPSVSLDEVVIIFKSYDMRLQVVNPRLSKSGDYRYFKQRPVHRIRINGNLSPFEFLITFLHEVAHMMVTSKGRRPRLPHGEEWQHCFREIGNQFIAAGCFPENIKDAFLNHINKGYASTFSDANLRKALAAYSEPDNKVLLEQLAVGDLFVLNRKTFRKGQKLRSRHSCLCIDNQRTYLVRGHCPVMPRGESV